MAQEYPEEGPLRKGQVSAQPPQGSCPPSTVGGSSLSYILLHCMAGPGAKRNNWALSIHQLMPKSRAHPREGLRALLLQKWGVGMKSLALSSRRIRLG